MKKFFSFFCYIAIAIAASLVSCGDDDDILDPESKPNANTIPVYVATIDDNALDIFDITLNIYRSGQKQEVVLAKDMITPITGIGLKHTNSYYCSSVNGKEGVDSVMAEVAIKSDIEAIVASKDPESSCYFLCYGKIKEVNKAANGDYSSYCEQATITQTAWKNLLLETNGVVRIEKYCADVKNYLSKK